MANLTEAGYLDTRRVVLEQEITAIKSKLAHYQGRISRGSADDEDRVCAKLYERILDVLCGLRIVE